MAAPFHIIDVSPTGYAVPLNTNIIVSFNEPVDPGTINDFSLTLTTDTGYSPVDGRIYSSGALSQVALEPYNLLTQNTRYRAIVPSPGLKAGGDDLEETYVWRFTTGNVIASGTETIAWEDPGTGRVVDSLGDTTLLKVLYQEKTLKDQDTLIPSGGGLIQLEFNAAPSGDLEWLSGFITLTSMDVLGWGLEGNHIGGNFLLDQNPVGESILIDILAPTAGAGVQENTEYTLTVKGGVKASGYAEMVEDYIISWTTAFHPVYSTSVLVRLLSGPFVENIPDDTVRRVILHYSRKATLQHGNTLYSPVPSYVTDYVTCQTAVDVIRQEFSARAGYAGRKHLGDLTIEMDVKDILTLLKDTLADLQTAADEAWGLIETNGRKVKPTVIMKSRYASGPKPTVHWSRILDWGGAIRYTSHGPECPEWLSETGSREQIYHKYLGQNPMPSTIEYNEYTYTLTNSPNS